MTERKPLYEYFKEDKHLFETSFMYGRYYTVTNIINVDGKSSIRMERVLRRKERFRIKRDDVLFMDNSMDFAIGDLVFFDRGGHERIESRAGAKIRHHFEFVGSLLKDDVKIKPDAFKRKVMKKYPSI